MIAGYQLNVCFYEAMELFEVLLSALSAVPGLAVLSNGRLIHLFIVTNGFELDGVLALELFMEMQGIGMKPHAITFIAGHLEQAKNIIERMPVTARPNKVIWMSLLCGARNHGNLEIGEYAA
ncbi:hypothetical protein L195_g029391 [Trifolium pratense]|uniref:Pentatricopeptide repeat-containing protein n=1 Tax=Trifolium pratense TaxID=57577 RepID=A0A2K3L4P5_TRIPR|nr:hypothetical protein L195_g029391 [Trifolium pratense]